MHKFTAIMLAAGLTLCGAAARAASTTCDVGSIQGSYALHGQGWTGTAAPFSPVAVIGLRSFDGAGDFSGSGYEVSAGTPQATSTTGTYTVKKDCTVTLTFTNSPGPANQTQYGVVTDDGNTVYVTRLDSGYTISLVYGRVTPR